MHKLASMFYLLVISLFWASAVYAIDGNKQALSLNSNTAIKTHVKAHTKANVTGLAFALALASKDIHQPLYTEQYFYSGTVQSVQYLSSSSAVFAEKTISYSRSRYIPKIDFYNTHCAESYVIEQEKNNNLKLHYKNACDREDAKHKVRIKEPSKLVIDAGFDNRVRDNLERISKHAITFDYLLPSRGSLVSLKAKRTSCKKLKTQHSIISLYAKAYTLQNWQYCVQIKPNNWLLSTFSPPILLAYSADKRLQFFSGKSNISDAQGHYPSVAIFYTYNHSSDTQAD